jgi:hypothetical protein
MRTNKNMKRKINPSHPWKKFDYKTMRSSPIVDPLIYKNPKKKRIKS